MGGTLCRPLTSTEVFTILDNQPDEAYATIEDQIAIMNPGGLTSCPAMPTDGCVSTTIEFLCLKESTSPPPSTITLCQNALILLPAYAALAGAFIDVTGISEITCEAEPCWIVRGADVGEDELGNPTDSGFNLCAAFKQTVSWDTDPATPFALTGVNLLDADLAGDDTTSPPFIEAFNMHQFDLASYDVEAFDLIMIELDGPEGFGGSNVFCYEGDVGSDPLSVTIGGEASCNCPKKANKGKGRSTRHKSKGRYRKSKGGMSSKGKMNKSKKGKMYKGKLRRLPQEQLVIKENTQDAIARKFSLADTNGDGSLSLEEVRAFLH